MSPQNQFKDISIHDFTDRSVIVRVRRETRQYREDLKKLGGKYISRLKGEPGWIFPKSKLNDIILFMKEGIVIEQAPANYLRKTLEFGY